MKPIKPKPLSRRRLEWLHACAVIGEVKAGRILSVDDARAILAALEHANASRFRAEDARDMARRELALARASLRRRKP